MRWTWILPLLLVLFPLSAGAATQHTFGPITVKIMQKGEQLKKGDDTLRATGSFSASEIKAVANGMNYWVQRLQSSQPPAIVLTLAKVKSAKGGSAYSWTPTTDRPGSDLHDYIVLKTFHRPQPPYDYHTLVVFQDEYTTDVTRALMNASTIVSAIAHELMHALDMGGNQGEDDYSRWRFESGADAWITGLQDIFGTKSVIGNSMEIKRLGGRSGGGSRGVFYLPNANADVFTLASGQKNFFATFHGPNVDALTAGRGMPVHGGTAADTEYGMDGVTELGHPAIIGSSMSYSPLCNMLFTELELAMIKDMGYNINLKKSYGKSYYPTYLGGALTPDKPGDKRSGFLAENAQTVTNTEAFASDFVYGLGLHVYRDKLHVTQGANIHASGHGGGGIRVDGVANTVTVPSGITVAANGENGTGIVVAYGKHNIINLSGTVQAKGPGGVGAHFGVDPSGTYDILSYASTDARGFVNSDGKYLTTKINSDMNGALVKELNVSGTLEGKQAAILIDNTAHVAAIRVQEGANIKGNIHSSWARNTNGQGNDYSTKIIFGTAGRTGEMSLTGNIVWENDNTYTATSAKNSDNNEAAKNSLHVVQQGGNLHFNGTAHVQTWKMEAGATLSGHGDITLGDGTKLRQGSTVLPGKGARKSTASAD